MFSTILNTLWVFFQPNIWFNNIWFWKALVDRTIRTVADESQKLRGKFEAEGKQLSPKLEATVNQVYQAAVKAANDFKTQADSVVNSITKKN